MNAKRPIIEKHDLPAGTMLDTREGMKIAYGILWMTWIDKTEKESVAASMAREILRAELSQDECGEGISLVRSIARQVGSGLDGCPATNEKPPPSRSRGA